MALITSTQNPHIKSILQLEKARNRKKEGLFLIEGFRETDRALRSGYRFRELLYCREVSNYNYDRFVEDFPASQKTEISHNVFSRIAYRGNHDGLIAISLMREHKLEDYTPPANGLFLVLEEVEKPGNLGALLRTADAAGIDAVFICNNQTEIYNPNVIRASLGCLFSNRIIQTRSEEAVNFFRENKISIFAAALQDSKAYYDADLMKPSALILGSEAKGLGNIWRKNADSIIYIPMAGIADSLNVSASAAILMFEAVRQRKNERH
jgi:TrmH family RNA methyltransferase